MQSAYEMQQFKQQNILLQDLTFGNSFKEFENHDFYLSANSMLIKTIQVQNHKYAQFMEILQYSENIYSTISICIYNQKQNGKQISYLNIKQYFLSIFSLKQVSFKYRLIFIQNWSIFYFFILFDQLPKDISTFLQLNFY
ncbi:unnamed protein product [Paramecium pentaurelia]|uniref:Uncharacterized protein n=1 Tax=Paramecium pentaurelia TaxID=43138 RepID=A0A8S1YPX2_9CILI|nr:unnamed protein product [Paramecium pentaurelia]